ncbi:hypothetical protein GN958_ATG16814, partial [Phytophthora infestans]
VMQLEVHYAPYPTGQINEFESCTNNACPSIKSSPNTSGCDSERVYQEGPQSKGWFAEGERISIRLRHDAAKQAYDGLLLGDGGQPTGKNAVSARNTAPRADVDSRTLREKSSFWQDVQAAFVQRYPLDHEQNQLMFDHELFRRVDPSLVKPHSSKKLYDMSKEIIRLYFSADERITASGQNENDFPNSVNKNGAVPYLRNG